MKSTQRTLASLTGIFSLTLLMSCGANLGNSQEESDQTANKAANEDEKLVFGDNREMKIGADGNTHFYPESQSISVSYSGLSLVDESAEGEPSGDPIEGDPVEGDPSEAGEQEPEEELEGEDAKDANKCGDWVGENTKITKITGNKQDIAFEPNSVLALFVAGNQNQVSISLAVNEEPEDDSAESGGDEVGEDGGEEEPLEAQEVVAPQFDGICLILSGNQAEVNIDVAGFEIGHFAVIGRGNKPVVNMKMDERANVLNSTVDIRGNGGALVIEKEGDYECPEATLKGNKTTVTCT